MRHDKLLLTDVLAAASAITRSLEGRSFDDFVQDDDLRDATLFRLLTIGEAIAHVTNDLRQRHPEIDWTSAVGFLNHVIHGYFNLNQMTVWQTATDDIPELRRQMEAILEQEFSDNPVEESGGTS